MRLACYKWGGARHVGRLSEDGTEVTPLAVGERARRRGVLALVEHLAEGGSMPSASGPRLPLSAVHLDAPFPLPRRNIFCVGKNYHDHAKEFANSGFDSSRSPGSDIPEHPIIFSKVPECVIAPGAMTHSGTLEKMIGCSGMSEPGEREESKPLLANSFAWS